MRMTLMIVFRKAILASSGKEATNKFLHPCHAQFEFTGSVLHSAVDWTVSSTSTDLFKIAPSAIFVYIVLT